jgi:hypothetical protein
MNPRQNPQFMFWIQNGLFQILPFKQCSVFVTFCYGFGYRSGYFLGYLHNGQTNFLFFIFCLLLFEGTFTTFFKDKKS